MVDLPDDCRPIGCKWVFKTKIYSRGQVKRDKSRLVAKRYNQREVIDYKDTFSSASTFRVILAIVTHFNLELYQMDVRTAFLNSDLSEDVYMIQPLSFGVSGKENIVCKL